MKTKGIIATTIALLILAVFIPTGSAVQAGENKQLQEISVEELNNELNKIQSLNSNGIGIGSNKMAVHTTSISAQGMQFPRLIDYQREEMPENMTKYVIKFQVGLGKYDFITLTSFAKEASPYHTEAKKILTMSLGQGLTGGLYGRAVEQAKSGDVNVVLFGRREDNIKSPLDEAGIAEMNGIMGSWNKDIYLQDMYWSVVISKLHTAMLSRADIRSIEVIGWGHSLGEKFWKDYLENGYGEKPFGDIKLFMAVDMATEYDPIYGNLIDIQKEKCYELKRQMANGTYYSDEGAMILYITAMAFNPETRDQYFDFPGMPELSGYTNIQVFRMMNFMTWQFGSPFTSDFHNLDGNLTSLNNVDERKIMAMILDGGVVAYTPLFEDEIVVCQLGNVSGYESKPENIDVPVIYYGLNGGFGHYGEYAIRLIGAIKDFPVITKVFNTGGHASILFVDSKKVDRFWQEVRDDTRR